MPFRCPKGVGNGVGPTPISNTLYHLGFFLGLAFTIATLFGFWVRLWFSLLLREGGGTS